MPDARRPVRQHRPRQLVADRRPARAEARRLRDHRVGVRLRHGDGEVHRHRLPRRRPCARTRSSLVATVRALKHHGGRDDDSDGARRSGWRRSSRGSRTSHRHLGIVARVRAPGRGRRQPAPRGHRRGGRAGEAAGGPRAARSPPPSATASPRAARASPTWPRRSSRRATSRTSSASSTTDGATIKEKIETDRQARRTAPRRSSTTWRPRTRSSSSPTQGLAELPVCMAKTPLSLSARTPSCSARRPTSSCPVRDVRAYTGAGWLVPLCGAISRCPGSARPPPPSTSTSTTRGGRSASSETARNA